MSEYMKKIYSTSWDSYELRTYKKDRKSPPFSANDYKDGVYGVGVDGEIWVVRTTTVGYERWLHANIERTPEKEHRRRPLVG